MPSHYELHDRIRGSESVDQALGILAENVSAIGVERFIAGFVRGSPRRVDGRWRHYHYRAFNFPDGWDQEWKDFNANCPYYHACFDGQMAFDWKKVREQSDLTALEVDAWHYLADYGLIQGYTVPVHAPNHFGFLTVLGDSEDRRWCEKVERQSEKLLYLTHAFHEAMRHRFPAFVEASDDVTLSGREVECLRWAAAGKTSDEVASILGISHETVRVYFKRAMRKVGANTRTQAVAIAYEMRLFS